MNQRDRSELRRRTTRLLRAPQCAPSAITRRRAGTSTSSLCTYDVDLLACFGDLAVTSPLRAHCCPLQRQPSIKRLAAAVHNRNDGRQRTRADAGPRTRSRGAVNQILPLFVVALWNRADHYIFALWFLSFYLFFFPRLISAAADWMSTILRHMVWP